MAELAAEPAGPAAPLPGCHSIFLTGGTLKLVNIEIVDPKLLIEISKKVVLDDIQFRGAISDFQPLKAAITKSEIDPLVLRVNEDDRYGDGNNFEICCSAESLAAWQKELEELLAAAQAVADVAGPGTGPRPPPPRVEIQPARPWEDLGSEAELEAASVRPTRELASLKLSRKRRAFGQPLTLSDKDSQELWTSSQNECRPFRDPNFDLRRMELDASCQAAPATVEAAGQAKGGQSQNGAVQTAPREGEVSADVLATEEMKVFLWGATSYYEMALQQNECFDVFDDDFSRLGEDDNVPGGKGDLNIAETQSFTDLAYSKGRTVSCIGWLPGRKGMGMVAVSCTDQLSFNERLELDGVVRTSAVLVWSFADAIHPQYILEAPSDIHSFQFNPTHHALCVGGLYNGQVVQWDVTAAQEQVGKKDKRRDDEPGQGTLAVKPMHSSSLEASHNCAITDCTWLPPEQEVTSKGKMVAGGKAGECNFFVTLAADGRLLFWDRNMKVDPKRGELPWAPTLEVALTRVDVGGTLAGCRFAYSSADKLVTKCVVASLDGEVGLLNLERPDDVEQYEYCKQLSATHSSPVSAIQISPIYPELLLSVGDWTFQVWKDGGASPIFSSPPSAASLSAGCWSPSRPGVLYVARADGVIEAWDFLDRSHEPSVVATIASCAITQLNFQPGQGGAQHGQLAAGDSQGALHIIDLPRSLRRMQPKEKQLILTFFEREELRGTTPAGSGGGAAAVEVPPPLKVLSEQEQEDLFRKEEAAVKLTLGIT